MENRSDPHGEDWLIRACRVVAVLLIGSAVAVWLRPITVPGNNLQPFGCGAPASPNGDALAEPVCSTDRARVRWLVLALLLAGILVLTIGEVVVGRLRPRGFERGLAVEALVGVPVFVLGVVAVFAPVVVHGANGTVLRCASPAAPTSEEAMRALCGQATVTALDEAVADAALAAVIVLGVGYVFAAAHGEHAAARPSRPSRGDAEVQS